MSGYSIDIAEFLRKGTSLPVIDVRTPAEYAHAHIPLSINLPLLTNEERSEIGTLYFRKGSSEAVMQGLKFVGPRIAALAEEGRRIASEGEALIHCWRGGMRSNSMAWLMNTAGIKTSTLAGGYKSYRRYLHEYFLKPLNLIVIGGMTGSGKSAVLEVLESKGKQVIHFERLARHRGSVFGGIGMQQQPSTEQFENDLFCEIRKLDLSKPVYTEDESLAIGNVFIPGSIYEQMSVARFIRLKVPIERRLNNLVNAYGGGDKSLLTEGVKRIARRIGLENASVIINCIRKDEMSEAVLRMLKYYDKLYERSMTMHNRKEIFEIIVTHEDEYEIAERIEQMVNGTLRLRSG